MDAVEALTRLGGIATTRELLALTSRRRLEAALGDRSVIRLGRNRFALPTADAARAAAIRTGGVVSHLSAAQHWGWKVKHPPSRPTITVPRRRHGLDAGDVELHWADLPREAVRDGVTTPEQTVVDCCRAYDFDVALPVVDSALRCGMARGILRRRPSPRRARGAPGPWRSWRPRTPARPTPSSRPCAPSPARCPACTSSRSSGSATSGAPTCWTATCGW